MSNSFRTNVLMIVLTVLFLLIGGELDGQNGAFLALIAAEM